MMMSTGLGNLVGDGNMEASGLTGWNDFQAVSSKQTTNPHSGKQVLRLSYDGTHASGLTYWNAGVLGKTYRIKGCFRGTGASAIPRVGIGSADFYVGTSSASWQCFETIKTATTLDGKLRLQSNELAVNDWVEFDDIQVSEYSGTETMQKNIVTDGNMEKTNATVPLVNGDFEGAAGPPPNGWTQDRSVATRVSGTRTGGTGSYVANVAYDGANATGGMSQNVLTIGHVYRVIGWARGDGTATPGIYSGGTGWVWYGTSSASWQSFDATFQAGSADLRVWSALQSAGTYVQFDDITITDVTAGSWPPFNAIISKQTVSPHAGNQVLRVQYDGTHTGVGAASQSWAFGVGKKYRVTGYARGDGTAHPFMSDGSGFSWWTGTASTAWQKFDIVFSPTINMAINTGCTSLNTGRYCDFDDWQVMEYFGPVNMPQNKLADGNMEATNVQPAFLDGNMENANATTTSGGAWTRSGSNVYLSKTSTSPHSGSLSLRVNATDAASPSAYQSILTTGHTYHVTGWIKSDGTTLPRVYVGLAGGPIFSGSTATTWQAVDVYGVANDARFGLVTTFAGSAYFDDFTIYDVTAGSYTIGNAAIASKQTNNPHGGNQVLRVAHNGTANPYVYSGTMVVGKRYRATGWARSDGNCVPRLGDMSSGIFFTGTNSTAWQRFDKSIIASGSAAQFVSITCGVAGQYTEWDDVSVTLDE